MTSPEKVFFTARSDTKLDLVRYYLAVEQPFLDVARGRPALMQRFPDGAAGKSFFQKRVPAGAPPWLQTTMVTTPNGTTSNALVLADMAHVVWAVNLGCLGFHVWPTHWDDMDHADELRIDLDPSPGVTLRDDPGGRSPDEGVPGRARDHLLPEDHRQPGRPRLRAPGAAMGLLRRPLRRGGPGPGARTPPGRPRHRGVVEGGARGARLHRLQPERPAQDGVRRVVRAGPADGQRVDAAAAGTSSTTSCPTT